MKYHEFTANYLSIPGFAYPESYGIWDFFLCDQTGAAISGDLLEIGAYYGRSAVLLGLHADTRDRLILIDSTDFLAQAKANVSQVKKENVLTLKNRSDDPDVWRFAKKNRHSCRFIHIDGEHRAQAVLNDLKLADILLREEGLVSVDDFFASSYPTVSFAVFQYLIRNRGKFHLFLCGYNKAYLARPAFHRHYLDLVRNDLGPYLDQLGFRTTIFKTDYNRDLNVFGIQERWKDYLYYGPDAEPGKIEY